MGHPGSAIPRQGEVHQGYTTIRRGSRSWVPPRTS